LLLTALNTRYSGDGSAEAFNMGGKTDILVRHEGSNLLSDAASSRSATHVPPFGVALTGGLPLPLPQGRA
jgi:hypothetical protein